MCGPLGPTLGQPIMLADPGQLAGSASRENNINKNDYKDNTTEV